MNPLAGTTVVLVCSVVGLVGGVLIHYGLKGLKR